MAVRQALSQITTTDDEKFYLLTALTDEGREGVQLTLCDGQQTWSGSVSEDNLIDMSRKVKMDYEEFITQTRSALTRENVGSISFIYQVKINKDSLQLTWKKHIPADDIKFQLGTAELKKTSDSTSVMRELFDFAIRSSSDLKQRISALESDNQRLISERATALKRLDSLVSTKEQLEVKLYSQFAVILNEKKMKLKELKEEVEELRTAGPSYRSVGDGDAGPSKSGRSVKDDDDDDDHTTDDEDQNKKQHSDREDNTTDDEVIPPTKRSKVSRGRQKQTNDADDSLLLDDPEDDDLPATTRRRRKHNTGPKKTPSKPVLPKVGSGNRTGKTPLRKTSSHGSQSSNRSSDNIDADDLIGDL